MVSRNGTARSDRIRSWTGRSGRTRKTLSRSSHCLRVTRSSESFGVEVGATLDHVLPRLDLPLPPDVVGDLLPLARRALHRLLGCDAAVEGLLEVHVERVEILPVALQRDHRHGDPGVLERDGHEVLAPVLLRDLRVFALGGTEGIPEAV